MFIAVGFNGSIAFHGDRHSRHNWPSTIGNGPVLSHLGNELHVPMLSFTALDQNLTPLQYPYFIQTAPDDLYQMTAVAEIISYLGWEDVVAAFSDDDHNRNGVLVLDDQLARRRCKISYKAPLPPDPKATRSDITAVLSSIQQVESRVIVLYSFFLAAIKRLLYALPYRFIMVGDGCNNPSYNDLINMVAADVIDAAVGDIAIVANWTKLVDFTQPYIESGLVVVAPVRELSSCPTTFLPPFTPLMWAVAARFFLVVGTVVWILEHRINDEFRGPRGDRLLPCSRENTMSSLGHNHLVGLFAENYLIEELDIGCPRLLALGSPEDYVAALESDAVVDEQPCIDLFLTNHCRFSVRGEQFTKAGWGFAFLRYSPLAIDISTALLTLSENGELQKIHDEWLSKKSCSS